MKREVELQDELKDIVEMIRRFVAANRSNVAFVGSFLAFDDSGHVRRDANREFAFGDKNDLRVLVSELRNTIEDTADSDNFVNL